MIKGRSGQHVNYFWVARDLGGAVCVTQSFIESVKREREKERETGISTGRFKERNIYGE